MEAPGVEGAALARNCPIRASRRSLRWLCRRCEEACGLGGARHHRVELMPVNDFPGTRNWGYDGVLPFAPDRAYGSPDELKALVDAAHEHGLMIFLDVVYNHFGPDGNYLPSYAPDFFRDDVKTPWGPAIDFRRPQVRRFFAENALYWLMEYRFDGLRFDAVHAIADQDWPDELAIEIRANRRTRPFRPSRCWSMRTTSPITCAGASTRNGTMTHTMSSIRCLQGRRTATIGITLTVPRRCSRAALPKALRIRGSARPCARANRAERPALILRRRRSSSSCKITIRSATDRSASDCCPSPRARR